jgi:hypothetical protein
MTLAIGDKLYTQSTSTPDRLGVAWIAVTRREVLDIEGDTIRLSQISTAQFPVHSAPGVEAIAWQIQRPAIPSISTPGRVAVDYLTELELPEPEIIDESAVRAAWLDYTNHRHTNRERGKPAPAPADSAQAYQFHILEWRDGLPSPSAG